MKKRFAIIHPVLAIAVLFSMLFQSLHSYEHLAEQLSEKHCHHDYRSAHEITHQHHNYDHCFICDFSLGHFVSPEIFSESLSFLHSDVPCFFSSEYTLFSFSSCNHPLRGPPDFIV